MARSLHPQRTDCQCHSSVDRTRPGAAVGEKIRIGTACADGHDPGRMKSREYPDGRAGAWEFVGGGWVDGAAISAADRAVRYGMSLFETVAIFRGRPIMSRGHLDRLARAARELGWTSPHLPDILPDAGQLASDGVLRVYLTAGPGAPGDPLGGSVFALFEPCEVGTDFPPLRAISIAAPVVPAPGGWKTGNYWQNIRALGLARSAGADEALVFNPAGALVGASMGNLFFEVEGEWMTPAREAGARDGVVREWVIGRLSVGEVLAGPDVLARATACFVTNSRVGIRPVCELDGRPLADDLRVLRRAYRDEVLGERDAYQKETVRPG
jgi:branched-subunit amino acid aminotransferase/4-amino-4-deoxychorismate lyase